MQNGALPGDVDFVGPEHGVDVVLQAGLLGEVKKQRDGLAVNSVLREVEVQPQGFQRGRGGVGLRLKFHVDFSLRP
jgi:hypothetical protein